MSRFVLLLVCNASVMTVISSQCADYDNPNCPFWEGAGLCTDWSFPLSVYQQLCPKTCINSGCNCPIGSTLVGPPVNGVCPYGTQYFGAVCCQIYCPAAVSNGPCNADNSCHTLGYACSTTSNYCCPVVDYSKPGNVLGPAIGGICTFGYTLVMVPGGAPEGECVSLQTVPGICNDVVAGGSCQHGCAPGYQCNTLVDVCCPAT